MHQHKMMQPMLILNKRSMTLNRRGLVKSPKVHPTLCCVHKVDPGDGTHGANTVSNDMQEKINKAMAHTRDMGISITPKMHGMEAHVVGQMHAIPGGISKLIEHWVEQYHQVGHRYDLSYCRAGKLERQACYRSVAEKRARHPKVKMSVNRVKKRYVNSRKTKISQRIKSEEKVRIKQERRTKAFSEFDVKLEVIVEELQKKGKVEDDMLVALDGKIKTINDDVAIEEELDEIEELEELDECVRRSGRTRRSTSAKSKFLESDSSESDSD